MKVPLALSIHGIDDPDIDKEAIRLLINEKVKKLESVCSYIISCHVAVEQPQKHQKSGIPYRVRIDVRIPPNHEIVIKRDPHKGGLHEPLSKIIRDTFDVMRRRLKEQVNRQHHKVKLHEKKQISLLESREELDEDI